MPVLLSPMFRRATVGIQSIENTHPFHNGRWIFAHNGTVPNFDLVRDKMLPEIDHFYRDEIRGTTDSEHVFYYILTLWRREPDRPLLGLVRQGLAQIVDWCRKIDPEARIGLNIVLTDGQRLVGTKLGRTLWHLEREHTFDCPDMRPAACPPRHW